MSLWTFLYQHKTARHWQHREPFRYVVGGSNKDWVDFHFLLGGLILWQVENDVYEVHGRLRTTAYPKTFVCGCQLC